MTAEENAWLEDLVVAICLFGGCLVVFYSISTLVGYLMPIYTYMICK